MHLTLRRYCDAITVLYHYTYRHMYGTVCNELGTHDDPSRTHPDIRPCILFVMMRDSAVLLTAVASLAYLMYRWKHRRSARVPNPPLAFASCTVHRVAGYKVYVSLPLNYEDNPKEHYPSLVVLDAEPYLFPLMVVCARTNKFFARTFYYPDTIVIGVVADLEADGSSSRFKQDGRLDVNRFWHDQRPTRARDYLPTAAESPWGTWPGAQPLKDISGHADDFASFVATTLVPFIDREYRTMGKTQRALIGKSFGGCGVCCCMIHPDCAPLFSEYVACSPSLTWDDSSWFRIERERREAFENSSGRSTSSCAPPHAAAVYCLIGSEESPSPGISGSDALYQLKSALDSRTGADVVPVSVEVATGETHGSVSYPFVNRAMEFLKDRWQRLQHLEHQA